MSYPANVQFVNVASGATLSGVFACRGRRMATIFPAGLIGSATLLIGTLVTSGQHVPLMDPRSSSLVAVATPVGSGPVALSYGDLVAGYAFGRFQFSAAQTITTTLQVLTVR